MNERIKTILDLPLHQHIGVQQILSESGNGILTAVVNHNALNPAGLYHGGMMYMLCDVCAYSGLLSSLNYDEDAVTHDIHVSVMRPAQLHDVVAYQSVIIKRGKQLCFIDVKASVGEKLIATARITKSIIKFLD